jgi:RXT2-like, N-terminal
MSDILRPLKDPSELPSHPRMSRPYLEPGLPEMINKARESLQREQAMLWEMKELFVRFRGDVDWLPVGQMHTDYDDSIQATIFDETPLANRKESSNEGVTANLQAEDAQMNGVNEQSPNGQLQQEATLNGNGNSLTNGHVSHGELVQSEESPHPQSSTAVHPLFSAPPPPPPDHFTSMNPDLDPLGPLHAYISKQEEIVRLSNNLLSGLLKSLRMRREVYGWCKAEGHRDEMSDGEDWVDLEEWGLEPGDLVKGKEEDDNENGNGGDVAATNRRGRRRVGEGR